MKKLISSFLAFLLMLSIVQPFFALAEGQSNLYTSSTEEDDFSDKLNKLINKYNTSTVFSNIIIDLAQSTIQKDDEEPISLSQFDADYSCGNFKKPVIPIVAVLKMMGKKVQMNSETGKITLTDQRESFNLKENFKVEGEILCQKVENGFLKITTALKTYITNVGYMDFEQAESKFGLKCTYENGKINISSPFESMRLCVHTKGGKKLFSFLGAKECINDGNGYYIMQFSSVEKAKTAYNILSKSLNIESVSPDTVFKTTAANLSNRDGAKLIQSDRFKNYLKEKNKTDKIIVAVADTGVQTNHPFLKDRLLKGKNFSYSETVNDVYGHGTHVAGIIKDNTPSNVKILPVKVMGDDGSGYSSQIAQGINYAVKQGAKVINMSLGGTCYGKCEIETAVLEAIKKGVTVCVAAGNDCYYTDNCCPAKIKDCITVAAMNEDGSGIAEFSNFGKSVDVAAPGTDILSSYVGSTYEYLSGTSMATPFVAAAAAMLLTENKSLKPAQVEQKLKSSCVDFYTKGWDKHTGNGMIDMGLLLKDKKIEADYIAVNEESQTIEYYSNLLPFKQDTTVFKNKGRCNEKSIKITVSDPKIASYDGRFVTPKASGKVTITVQLANGKKSSFTLTLKKIDVWVDHAAKSYSGGDGSKKNPYLISNANELAKFAKDVRSNIKKAKACYKLTKDIDLKGKKWISAAYVNPYESGTIVFSGGNGYFFGSFDGGNHVIKNMDVLDTRLVDYFHDIQYITNTWADYNNGFFGNLEGATVKNLGIADAFCYNNSGILADEIRQGTRISNCYTSGFSTGYGFCGNITNYDISIKNCFSSAKTIKGGFCSQVYSSMQSKKLFVDLKNCFFCGEILNSESQPTAGGFANTIEACRNYNCTRLYSCFCVPKGNVSYPFIKSNTQSAVYNCYSNISGKKPKITSQKKIDIKIKGSSFFKTKKNFTTKSNWSKNAQWDFKNTWKMDGKTNGGLPYLKKIKFISNDVTKRTGTWLDKAAGSFAGGNGSKDKPYLVSTPQQLALIAYKYRFGGGTGVYFKLTKDIDLKGNQWFPIGGGTGINTYSRDDEINQRLCFFGNIDGNGKSILNMNISCSGSYVGFISKVAGTVKNLHFKNADIKCRYMAGIVCGETKCESMISDCTVQGKIKAEDCAGGICGKNSQLSLIAFCKSNCIIDCESILESGGICKDNYAYIERCRAWGKNENSYTPSNEPISIVSYNACSIKNCFASTEILQGGGGLITNSYYTTQNGEKVGVYDSSGNLSTYENKNLQSYKAIKTFDFKNIWYFSESGQPLLQKSQITRTKFKYPTSYWKEDKSFAGGKGTKSNPYLIATPGQLLKAAKYIGKDKIYFKLIRNIDLKGKLWPSEASDGYFNVEMDFEGNGKTVSNLTMKNGGGLFPIALSGRIANLNLTNVSGSSTCALVSMTNEKAEITNCNITGSLSETYYDRYAGTDVGGICNSVSGDSITFKKCTVNMELRGTENVGILLAFSFSNKFKVIDCNFKGSVFGNSAGIANGRFDEKISIFKNCVANIKSKSSYKSDLGNDVYFNKSYTKSHTGIGLTTSEMKKKSSFKNFDFKNTWDINEKTNDGFPFLRKKANLKITYNLNGGKNVKYPQTDFYPGTTVTLQKPTKSGYTFVGWYTNKNFSGKSIKKITGNKNVTLYAKWKKSGGK